MRYALGHIPMFKARNFAQSNPKKMIQKKMTHGNPQAVVGRHLLVICYRFAIANLALEFG